MKRFLAILVLFLPLVAMAAEAGNGTHPLSLANDDTKQLFAENGGGGDKGAAEGKDEEKGKDQKDEKGGDGEKGGGGWDRRWGAPKLG